MRVLLIDDSTTIQKVIRLGLGAFPGAHMKVCDSLEKARQEFAEFAPEVVIGAQTVGGRSCAREYLELGNGKANVIALADHSEGEAQLRKLGYGNILRKPFTLGEFRDLLGSCVALASESEFSHLQHNEDTAQTRFPAGMSVSEVESAFRDTLELASASSGKAHFDAQLSPEASSDAKRFSSAATDTPTLTINLKELEGSLQKSLLGEVYVPEVSQTQTRLIDEHAAKAKAQKLSSLIGSSSEAEVQTLRQPESELESFIIEDVVVHGDSLGGGHHDSVRVGVPVAARPVVREAAPFSEVEQRAPLDAVKTIVEIRGPAKDDLNVETRPGTLPPRLPPKPRAAVVGAGVKSESSSRNSQENSSALLLEEYKRVQIERQIKDEITGLESRLKTQLRLELETQFMQSVEGLVKPQIDTYLNKQWPTVVKSITLQVKKSVESEYTSRMHSDLIQMQKRLALDLKAELRTEVQNALRNWMGSYSRDILKEVAREELQKLLESV